MYLFKVHFKIQRICAIRKEQKLGAPGRVRNGKTEKNVFFLKM